MEHTGIRNTAKQIIQTQLLGKRFLLWHRLAMSCLSIPVIPALLMILIVMIYYDIISLNDIFQAESMEITLAGS